MNTKLLLSLSLTLFPAFSGFASALKVEVLDESYSLEYPEPMRLAHVLTDTVKHSRTHSPFVYPIANQLFNVEKESQAQQIKTEVLKQLALLNTSSSERISANILIEQIKRWDIGYREMISLDLDQVRDQPSKNPMLSGHYQLVLPHRNNKIYIEGLLFHPYTQEFDATQKLSDILTDTQIPSSANDSYAWVIYPDGSFIKAGYAYWNDEKTNLTPGSIVFIGFNASKKNLEALEEMIVELISMRKVI